MTTLAPTQYPITALAGVGQPLAKKLAELDIHRIFDLLMHLPRNYEDRSRTVPMNTVENGQVCMIAGVITDVASNKGRLSVCLEDSTGMVVLQFFKTYPTLLQTMTVGANITAFGEIKVSRYGVQMAHPEYHITGTKTFESGLLPIYPTVKGLHQNKLRQLVRMAINAVRETPLTCLSDDDFNSVGVRVQGDLLSALTAIHLPDPQADIFSQTALLTGLKDRTHPACQRLIIEELTAHQLVFLYRKQNLHAHKAPFCERVSPLADRLVASLPFRPTNAQQRVVSEIVADLATSTPMLRLVQGDVGAGKTLVAGLSACHAIDSGWQVAIMAPTEILAEQHLINFKKWFEPMGVGVGWLAGKQTAKERNTSLGAIINNDVQIVVGTHALFQDGVAFAKLGLVIIDEQHRFGVEQRLKLVSKGVANSTPHQLAMTATPIPRTLAMSMYGDMDVSVIDELPPNRTPITTVTINRDRRDEVIERIRINCKNGKQAYWVCPLVEESTALDAQSAELLYEDLCERLDIRIGLVHGKMKAGDKQAVMNDFKQGDIDLLVATTVIEVGVDVPNASLMVIENAERLGLSQLHQLRGRVGRGSEKSFCVLLYQLPLSPTGIERLNILRDSTDGFVIAQKDLELRGAGELLGKRQTGDMGYYLADIVRDESLLHIAQNLANHLIKSPNKTALTQAMIGLWLKDSGEFVGA
ncbi:ATP-dependent DNA helicase RecG [Moraxella bovis]|uniref:ATP-dependent DNA helicase RecG n=1 Tax=Moraxella bovis TaxID=476 RepID=A0AAQ2Q276_MORBO|nr:ATP-dependent DNA helicase RecG [Moraxella bovis]UYZ76467.1 ATP-dependent DNA helicase RecG [Moraxella bovis]UYZ77581.1 ATP-dependent DNA helicase RecG [Moraxella bovis]UYZ86067.1 ATP-dependent DNA helicase RecG [Moraxella bovis]UYZ91500.1 ATP-dependent DNA helicase RecG [Moraxella bovis]UYZ98590.1 ATP-dependent DNA helicase RecG [Moraxella bovis]